MNEIVIDVWHAVKFWDMAVAAIFGLFCFVLYRLDRAADNVFKFSDFFTWGNVVGKADVSRLGYFGAFLSHSLIVLHKEMTNMPVGVDYATVSSYALIWSGAYVVLKALDLKSTLQGASNGPSSQTQSTP